MSAPAIETAERAKSRSALHIALTSFAAGVGAMAFVVLATPIVSNSGLAVAEAQTASVERVEPVLTAHEVAMIRSQLTEAEAALRARTTATNDEVARLARLARE
jgi:hypothetical protein